MYRTGVVRQQRRADTPLPELHSWELRSWELRMLARLRPGILAHPKLHSPERPAARHHSGTRGGVRAGNADGPSRQRSAGEKCAPNGYGGEERDDAAADGQAHAASV